MEIGKTEKEATGNISLVAFLQIINFATPPVLTNFNRLRFKEAEESVTECFIEEKETMNK